MSANQWRVCPRCRKNATKAIEDAERAVEAKYGEVSMQEFDALRKKVSDLEAARDTMPSTLREDYEISTDEDGEFEVDYSASCRECGYGHKFKESKEVTP